MYNVHCTLYTVYCAVFSSLMNAYTSSIHVYVRVTACVCVCVCVRVSVRFKVLLIDKISYFSTLRNKITNHTDYNNPASYIRNVPRPRT